MGKRVIIWYPESKDSMSTQYPSKIEHYVLATTEIEPEIKEIRTPDISTPKHLTTPFLMRASWLTLFLNAHTL